MAWNIHSNSRLRLSKKNTGLIVGVPPITELCHLLKNLICVNFRKHGTDKRFKLNYSKLDNQFSSQGNQFNFFRLSTFFNEMYLKLLFKFLYFGFKLATFKNCS